MDLLFLFILKFIIALLPSLVPYIDPYFKQSLTNIAPNPNVNINLNINVYLKYSLRYAIKAVLTQTISAKLKSLTWLELAARRDDKTVYVELWKRKLNTSPTIWATAYASAAGNKKKQRRMRKAMKSVHEFNTTNTIPQTAIKLDDYKKSHTYLSILEESTAVKTRTQFSNVFSNPVSLHLPIARAGPARYRSPNPSTSAPMYSTAAPSPRYEDKDKEKDKDRVIDEETALLLADIECHNSFDDIIYFRSLAEKDLPTADNNGHRSWTLGFLNWYYP